MSLIDRYSLNRRLRRFHWIQQSAQRPPGRPLRLLDVGGTAGYWASMPWLPLMPIDIVLLNMVPQDVAPPFTSVVGDGRDLSRYPDQSFDIVYSNSVIGHVGGLADQRRMALELQRVGRLVIVQTPNHWFPLDWRTLVPGFHLLPVTAQAWCLRHTRVGKYARERDREAAHRLAARVRNMTRGELREFFPRAAIHAERICGLTKSFIVVGPGRGRDHQPRPDAPRGTVDGPAMGGDPAAAASVFNPRTASSGTTSPSADQ